MTTSSAARRLRERREGDDSLLPPPPGGSNHAPNLSQGSSDAFCPHAALASSAVSPRFLSHRPAAVRSDSNARWHVEGNLGFTERVRLHSDRSTNRRL